MDFLDVVGVVKVWYVNFYISVIGYFIVVFIGQGDYFYFLCLCGFNGFNYVVGVVRCGDIEQYIVCVVNGFNVVGEYIFIVKIIVYVGEVVDVGDCDGWVIWVVFVIMFGQFFCKMYCIVMGIVVIVGQYFFICFKVICQQDSGMLDSMDIGFVLQKVSQCFCGFVQFVMNKILVYEDNFLV